jgi:RNA polymerase sigma factor (sigma-70 family)
MCLAGRITDVRNTKFLPFWGIANQGTAGSSDSSKKSPRQRADAGVHGGTVEDRLIEGERIGGNIMTAVSDCDIVSDAELATAAAAGDRCAFARIYDRYADRLYKYCLGLVRDHHAAADCVHDVFCEAARCLADLREPAKLRPWLYAMARHQALRHIRNRRREEVRNELPDAISQSASASSIMRRNELAQLIDDAARGLSERDRIVLKLAYRHGLDEADLAEVLGVSDVSAKKLVQRLHDRVERSLSALLVARHAAQNGCRELAVSLSGGDGQFSVLMRKRIARHIESCPICDADGRNLVDSVAILAGVFLKKLSR